MAVRVETDSVIYVPGIEPGSEDRRDLEIRLPINGSGVDIYAGKHGSQVEIGDLRTALDRAEECLRAEGNA